MGKLIPYAGKTPGAATRTERLDFRLAPEEKALIYKLAAEEDRTVTVIVMRAIRAYAAAKGITQ